VVFVGEGMVTGFSPGRVFELTDHVIPELDGRYVITSVQHNGGTSAQSDTARDRYVNHFTCVPFDGVYRPPVVTPWPRIHGIQTATVVGPAGFEIHTDEHARIRVQFHWDREGERNDHSSCFIRVAQQWAGSGYGFVFIPRIGHEVLVTFIEGNPDRPLVVGSVYNGDNNPHWELPANETRSVIRTKSFGDGNTGYNEISFEDQAGSEEILLHAQKDFNETVGNNHSTTVTASQTNSVGGSQTESVGGDQSMSVSGSRTKNITGDETTTVSGSRTETVVGDETITISGARTEDVTGDETITIAANRSETVAVDETVTIGANRTHTIGANDDLTVGSAQSINVGAMQSITVGAVRNVAVGGAQMTEIGGLHNLEVGAAQSIDVGGNRTVDIGGADTLKVGKKLVIEAADEITIKTGDATISMKKSGDITIKGKNITLQGSAKINLKASSDVVIKGSKVGNN
jgi:type VI secretion system secreted protein VgrG